MLPLQILIVDDSPIFRDRVRRLLTASSAVLVVGEASNGAEAKTLVERLMPQVVLLDLAMPEIDGFEVLVHVKELFPSIKVVVLTIDASAYARYRCSMLGAEALIDKADTDLELLPALLLMGMSAAAAFR